MGQIQMEWEQMTTILRIPQLLAALIAGIGVFRLGNGRTPVIILHTCEEFAGMLREDRRYVSWRERTEERLRRLGAGFHYGTGITALRYLLFRILLATAGGLVLIRLGTGYALLTMVVLFWLPEVLLFYLNRQDNLRMLPEIKLIYQALEVQIRAGVYVTDALTEMSQSVRERRLQQALLELAGDIVIQSDLLTALAEFQAKFDNRQLDALCITLIQATESGQSVELLQDMGEQLKDMELTVLNQQKSALDRSITFYQLGMLAAILGVILYACVGYMFRAAVIF